MFSPRRRAVCLCLAALLVGAASVTTGAEKGREEEAPTIEQIVEKANEVSYYQGGTGRTRVKMTIYDPDGSVRGERELIILRRNADEGLDQKFYVYFVRPADVRRTVFLAWKNTAEGKEDDRWVYNPGLDLVNRIAAADKRSSFVGTHFFYEDVSGRRITDDEHKLMQTTKDYYVLKNTPKDADQVEFAYYLMYIHRQTFLPLYVYYYDQNNEKYREYRVLKMEQIGGYWTPIRTEMRDLREKRTVVARTVAEYSQVRYGLDLPEEIFSERYLRKAPREYLE